jgi:hypothetical protein
MPDHGIWREFTEERTSGWKAEGPNGIPMEVWTSYDEPTQFRVSVDKTLEPEFYASREAAFAAAETIASNLKPA